MNQDTSMNAGAAPVTTSAPTSSAERRRSPDSTSVSSPRAPKLPEGIAIPAEAIKDYERVRSRIDDGRMRVHGCFQVARIDHQFAPRLVDQRTDRGQRRLHRREHREAGPGQLLAALGCLLGEHHLHHSSLY